MSAHDQLRFMHTLHGLQFGVYNATYANCPDNILYIGFLTCKHTCFLWSSSECSVTYSAFNFTTPVSTHLPNTPCAASTVFIYSLTSEACLGSLCTRLPDMLHCKQCLCVQQLQSAHTTASYTELFLSGTYCNDPRWSRCVSLIQSSCVMSCCRLLKAQEECQQLRKTIAGTRKRATSEADRFATRNFL